VFMLEAQIPPRHELYFLELRRSVPRLPQVNRALRQCELTRRGNLITISSRRRCAEYPIEHFDAVFIRRSPADAAYLYATMIASAWLTHCKRRAQQSGRAFARLTKTFYSLHFRRRDCRRRLCL